MRLASLFRLISMFAVLLPAMIAFGQQPGQIPNPNEGLPPGRAITCQDGVSFTNGVEVRVIEMRAGFTYTATAVGLGEFDPVLAVVDETGQGLCNDDAPRARRYTFNLPTTGEGQASSGSAQVHFSQGSGSEFADISLVVGGYGDSVGEFLLILEGMGVTVEDGVGDPFALQVTPGMTASPVPLTVYMLSRATTLDPYMYLSVNGNMGIDQDGAPIYCDDAGSPTLCYRDSFSLTGVTMNTYSGRIVGDNFDAMLQIPVQGLRLNSDPEDNLMQFVMTSYEQSSIGQYVLVFHIGTGEL